MQKGAFDWVMAAMLLVAAFPLLVLVAILVKLDHPGSVFVRQQRLGFNNGLFEVFRFRTMLQDGADAYADCQTTLGDPRFTRIGRFFQKASIDELPQLLNVLRARCHWWGRGPTRQKPRPGITSFHDVVAHYARCHQVKPCTSGWGQVNGWRSETRTFEQLEQRLAHHLYYIDNWSLMLDIKIIMLTSLRELNSKVAF